MIQRIKVNKKTKQITVTPPHVDWFEILLVVALVAGLVVMGLGIASLVGG